MAKHNGDAVWVNVDVTTLPRDKQNAYEDYKAMYRSMKLARDNFESSMQEGVPQGKRLVFGYNFGKLSVALVEALAPKAKAKTTTQSLADYMAAMQASGQTH